MSDLEKVQFKLRLSTDWFRLTPHVKIFLNDTEIEDTEIFEKRSEGQTREILFESALPDGDHELKIQYLGKEPPDTQVDEQGNIIADHLVHVEEIEIDDIELGFLARTSSCYYPDNELHPEAPSEMLQTVNLGYNGTWVLKFQVPTYIWFIENL